MSSFTYTITSLPVLCTDKDVNKLMPKEDAPQETVVYFQDPDDSEYEFPFCCGIGVIGGALAETADCDDEEVKPKHKKQFADALRDKVATYRKSGLLLYTLLDNQVTERECLMETGWKVMAVFRNQNTGNRVTLYGLLINQPRKRPVKK